jgi:phage terminase large subunit
LATEVTFDFTNKKLFNPVYLPIFHTPERYIVLYGGRGSGKSDVAAQKVIIDTLRRKFSKYVLVRKVHDQIRESQFDTIVDWIYRFKIQQHFSITTHPISITCLLNGNRIIARGLDKADKAKSLKDPTGIWYEEADQIFYDDFIKTTDSVRTKRPGAFLQEILTFNPENESSWINSEFFPPKETYEKHDGKFHFVKSIDPDAIILHTTCWDNLHVDENYRRRQELKKQKNFARYRVDALGLWGAVTEGAVYERYKIVEPDDVRANEVIYGVDFGFNDPSVVVKISRYEDDLYVEELFYSSGFTPKQFVDEFEKLQIPKDAYIYADSAEPGTIQDIFDLGYNIHPAKKGAGSKVEGIKYVRNFNLHIVSNSINTIREIKSYQHKKNMQGKFLEEPVDGDDHAMDAKRYAIHNHGLKFWKMESEYFSVKSINRSRASRFNLRNELKRV